MAPLDRIYLGQTRFSPHTGGNPAEKPVEKPRRLSVPLIAERCIEKVELTQLSQDEVRARALVLSVRAGALLTAGAHLTGAVNPHVHAGGRPCHWPDTPPP